MADALACAGSRLGSLGRDVRWYSEIGSTNDAAAAWAESGAPEGAVVLAEAQVAGRGRRGRVWASPPGAGLYLSVVLRPPPETLPLLTLAAGVAVADAIRQAAGLDVALKWPNDVYIGSRKVAGILSEAAAAYAVVGIGINVLPAAYPPGVEGRATSLEAELGRPVDRALLFAECLCAIAARYAALREGRGAEVLAAWRMRAAATMGRPVSWAAGNERITGVAEGVDGSGALLVRSNGRTLRIISGEVIWS